MSSESAPMLHCDARLQVGDVRDLLLPRHVLNGDGAARQLGSALSSWGVPSGDAFVVCDGFLYDSGVLDPMLDGLRSGGWTVEIDAGLVGEPTVTQAEAVVEHARRVSPVVVIGVGGGSAMDVAKVVALLCANDGPVDAHIGVDLPEQPAVPLALVPTTTGTGAESTRIAMLAGADGKRIISNRFLVPIVAVLDAELVVGLPPGITSATGMDALAHATESFLSTSSTALTTAMSLRAAELLRDWLPVAFHQPDNLEARRATLYGAFLAGLGLNAGVVLGHSMAYTVANVTHLAHGVTCALALPFCLAYNAHGEVEGIDQLIVRLTGERSSDLRGTGEWLLELNHELGMPCSLVDVGIAPEQVASMATECTDRYPRPTNPVPMTPEGMTALYGAWFDGDLVAAFESEKMGTP